MSAILGALRALKCETLTHSVTVFAIHFDTTMPEKSTDLDYLKYEECVLLLGTEAFSVLGNCAALSALFECSLETCTFILSFSELMLQ
jgi:hypothetical protein